MTGSRAQIALLAILCGLAGGCSGSSGADAGPIEVAFGCSGFGSDESFQPLAEGDPIRLAMTADGAVLVLFGLRIRGIEQGDHQSIRFRVLIAGETRSEGTLICPCPLTPVPDDSGVYEWTHFGAFVGGPEGFSEVDPQPIRMDVTVRDVDGRREDARWNGVTAYDPGNSHCD